MFNWFKKKEQKDCEPDYKTILAQKNGAIKYLEEQLLESKKQLYQSEYEVKELLKISPLEPRITDKEQQDKKIGELARFFYAQNCHYIPTKLPYSNYNHAQAMIGTLFMKLQERGGWMATYNQIQAEAVFAFLEHQKYLVNGNKKKEDNK